MKISLYRSLSAEQVEALQALSRQVVKQVQLRRNLAGYKRGTNARQQAEETLRHATKNRQLALAPTKAEGGETFSVRTTEQIKAEIKDKFGFIPPFFTPAQQNPQVLENLWQQTLFAYVNNPLPPLFKEKLSAYLSRYCAVPYCMICHSCSLRPLGMKAREVLELLESPPPIETDISEHLKLLAAHSDELGVWPEPNSTLEESLLYCSIFISVERDETEYCRSELCRLLGTVNYQHLVTFIAYVKTCHVWMEAHPEVAYEADKRVQENLSAFLEQEPGLVDFFRNYRERVRRERQSRAEQLAVLAERKRNFDALKKAAEENLRLAQAVASVSDGVLITDPNQPDNPIIYSNSAFSRLTGYRQDEIVGRNCRFLQGADTDPQTVARIRQAIAERREVQATLINYRQDGQPFWNELKISPVFSDEGDLLYFVGIQTDITERKQAEEQIREQATLLDKAQDAIFVLDLEEHILFWNDRAKRLFGWTASEAIAHRADELLFDAQPAQFKDAYQAVIAAGEWHGELQQVTKDGKEIIVESRWTLVRDQAEVPKSILVVNTDITQKKQLERQFLRTQRLESIGTLAGGIAHDLNNILTPILAASQLLQIKLPNTDERTQRMLKTLETNTKRGAALVKQVLSFARGVEGQHTTLQVRHLIAEIKQIVKQTFPKWIEFCIDVSPELWAVSGDATQLHQVLMNLCVNARDAMTDGGSLSISAENLFIDQNYARMHLEAKVGPYVAITVEDSGVGIPPEILDRIFEPFFTTKELGKGTGLGLATVIGIIKSHGGFINVSSQVSKGTQFKVFLPAVEATAAPRVEDIELPIGNGELILVVDDEAPIREITKISLESYNYKVILASDGIEAIALYAQHKHEIRGVLVDMMMPSMDGATTIRTLQKINPQVKIIAVSGLVTNNKLAQQVGINTFLSKPYTARELLQALFSVLNSKSTD